MSKREDEPKTTLSQENPPKILDCIRALRTAIMAVQDDITFNDKIKGSQLESDYRKHLDVLLYMKDQHERILNQIIAKHVQRPRLTIPGGRGN